jgi:hypothetical protein
VRYYQFSKLYGGDEVRLHAFLTLAPCKNDQLHNPIALPPWEELPVAVEEEALRYSELVWVCVCVCVRVCGLLYDAASAYSTKGRIVRLMNA